MRLRQVQLSLATVLSMTMLAPSPAQADFIDNLNQRIRSHPTVQARLRDGDAIANARIVDVSISPRYTVRATRIVGPKTEIVLPPRSEDFLAKNCTSVERTGTKKLSLTVVLESSITITAAADLKEDVSTTLSVSAADLPVSLSRETTKSATFSLSRQNTVRRQVDDVDEWEEQRPIPVHTALIVRARRALAQEQWPIEAQVAIDGDVVVYRDILLKGPRPTVIERNPMHFTLGELFPNESDRTTKASGFIQGQTAQKTQISYGEQPLDPKNPSQCPENFVPIAGKADDILYTSIAVNSPETSSRRTQLAALVTEPTTPNQVPIRQFFARGKHTCQSKDSLGHQCTVSGVGFFDCNQARAKLARQSCCHQTKSGGSSIGFKIERCTGNYPS